MDPKLHKRLRLVKAMYDVDISDTVHTVLTDNLEDYIRGLVANETKTEE